MQFQSNTLAILEDLTEKHILFDVTRIKQWGTGIRLNRNVAMIHILFGFGGFHLEKPGIRTWSSTGHIFTMD